MKVFIKINEDGSIEKFHAHSVFEIKPVPTDCEFENKTPLIKDGISTKLNNILINAEIYTVEDLHTCLIDNTFLKCRNAGPKMFEQAKILLLKNGVNVDFEFKHSV